MPREAFVDIYEEVSYRVPVELPDDFDHHDADQLEAIESEAMARFLTEGAAEFRVTVQERHAELDYMEVLAG